MEQTVFTSSPGMDLESLTPPMPLDAEDILSTGSRLLDCSVATCPWPPLAVRVREMLLGFCEVADAAAWIPAEVGAPDDVSKLSVRPFPKPEDPPPPTPP